MGEPAKSTENLCPKLEIYLLGWMKTNNREEKKALKNSSLVCKSEYTMVSKALEIREGKRKPSVLGGRREG